MYAFATIVTGAPPIGLRGLVLAAALAAVMSTASGALIACATVAANDIWPTVAYNLLVGGLLVPILGGLGWRRGTRQGALAAIGVGCATVTVLMFTHGLLASLAAYVVVSLLTPRTEAVVLESWQRRLAGVPS